MKGTLYGLGLAVTRCGPLGRHRGWCPVMPVTRLVSNKPVPRPPVTLDGAPAIPLAESPSDRPAVAGRIGDRQPFRQPPAARLDP